MGQQFDALLSLYMYSESAISECSVMTGMMTQANRELALCRKKSVCEYNYCQ